MSFARYTALEAAQKSRKQTKARVQAAASKSCPPKTSPASTKTFLAHCLGLIASSSAAAAPPARTAGSGVSATARLSVERVEGAISNKVGAPRRRRLGNATSAACGSPVRGPAPAQAGLRRRRAIRTSNGHATLAAADEDAARP